VKFQQFRFSNVQKGAIIEVTLKGSAANVRLMDFSNFNSYKAGRKHSYQGGLVKKSPFLIPVPRSGTWYVTVDLAGLSGRVTASVRVLPGVLPPAKPIRFPTSSLSSIPSLIHEPIGAAYVEGRIVPAPTYDVFISHASEDKDSLVRELANALVARDLDVWYDEFTLKIGDNLRQKIDQGIANSRFGVMVFSESFFSKGWTNHELDGLVTRKIDGQQELLPIWHGVSKSDVMAFSASLANTVALNTRDHSIEHIADEIAGVVLIAKGKAA
jgi:hypothetical protein